MGLDHNLLKLNLGSGPHREPGWLNVDVHRACYCESCLQDGPDLVCDIRKLPFEDGCASRVMLGHVLEHLPEDDVVPFLGEVKRFLAPGGKVCIVGPCFDKATALVEAGDPCDMRPAIWPGSNSFENEKYPGEGHQWYPTTDAHLAMVSKVFPIFSEVHLDDVPGEWPFVRFLYWQFAILAEVA